MIEMHVTLLGDGGRWWERFRWLTHRSARVLLGAALVAVVSDWLHLAGAESQVAQEVVGYMAAGVIFFTYNMAQEHAGTMCDRCLFESPVGDGAERAVKAARSLRLIHWTSGHNRLVPYGAAAVFLVPGMFSELAGNVATLVALVAITVVGRASGTHKKLQPWCPQCANGGWGKNAPVPVPAPSGGVPIPA